MRIFLGELELPAAPERFEMIQEGRWSAVDLETTGEVLLYRPPALRVFRFQSILPAQRYAFVTTEHLLSPAQYEAQLQNAAASHSPVRLVVADGASPFSMLAVIRSFQRWEQAGEDGDLYFSLELSEYREFGKKIITPVSGQAAIPVASPVRSGSPSVPQQYTVQKGDCLWYIAARFLGDGSRYREIAQLNNIANPNLIFPGQVIRLPD